MASIAESIIQQAFKGTEMAQESTDKIESSLRAGAELAMKKQELSVKQENLEQQRDLLQFKKVSNLTSLVENGLTKVPRRARKAYFNNFVKPQAEALKIPIANDFVDALLSDDVNSKAVLDNLANFRFGVRDAIQGGGNLSEDARLAGAQILEAFNGDVTKFGPFMNQAIGSEVNAFAQQQAQKAMAMKEEKDQQKEFDQFINTLSDDLKSSFAKIDESKKAVRVSYEGLSQVLADIRSGRQPNENQFNAAARGLAKAFNSGAMTDQDVADFKALKGLVGRGEELARSWVIGGVNETVAQNLLQIARQTATVLDKNSNEVGKRFKGRLQSEQFQGRSEDIIERSGFNNFITPTLPNALMRTPKFNQNTIDKLSLKAKELLTTKSSEDVKATLSKVPGMNDELINTIMRKAQGGQ